MSKSLKYRIKEIKDNKGLTYEDIGNICRRDRQTIYNWAKIEEGSIISVPADALRTLANLFECTMEELHTEPIHQPA